MHIVISLSKEKNQIKTLFLSQTFIEATAFIEDLKSISVNNEIVNITSIRKFPPKEDDHDGYYLVHNNFSGDQYDLFSKKTIINKGYFYNSAELEIKEIMTIFITCCNFTQNTESSLNNNHSLLTITPSKTNKSSIIKPGDLIDRYQYNKILIEMIEKSKLIDKKIN